MSTRSTYFLGLFLVTCLLLGSIYLQIFEGIMPCPLCTLQRLTFIMLGFLFLLGILLHSKVWGRIIINLLSIIMSGIGLFLAGRQVWLQHYPSSTSNECGVSLDYMLQVLPLNEVIMKVLAGSAECTQKGFSFMHLNMAEWSFIWFTLFLSIAFWLMIKDLRSSHHLVRRWH